MNMKHRLSLSKNVKFHNFQLKLVLKIMELEILTKIWNFQLKLVLKIMELEILTKIWNFQLKFTHTYKIC